MFGDILRRPTKLRLQPTVTGGIAALGPGNLRIPTLHKQLQRGHQLRLGIGLAIRCQKECGFIHLADGGQPACLIVSQHQPATFSRQTLLPGLGLQLLQQGGLGLRRANLGRIRLGRIHRDTDCCQAQ